MYGNWLKMKSQGRLNAIVSRKDSLHSSHILKRIEIRFDFNSSLKIYN